MIDWDERRAATIPLAIEAGFGRADAELIGGLSRPAARLIARPSRLPKVAASRLGGLPDLPRETDWPTGEFGPMTFCGQIRTTDARFLEGVEGWRPGNLLLSFFADKDPDGDEANDGRVLALDPDQVERREAPTALPGTSRFDEAVVEIVPALIPPMSELIEADLDHDLDADDWAAWERLYESLGCGSPSFASPHHQLLGRAWAIGDLDPIWMGAIKIMTEPEETEDEEAEDEATHYRLLAQFTTDQDANIEIADGGVIYFVIGAEELAAGSYERIGVHMESN